jgi:copper chaperone
MIDLKLPTMTCGHCAATVRRTIAQCDPHAQIDIDLPGQRVRIESEVAADALKHALREEGYPPADESGAA